MNVVKPIGVVSFYKYSYDTESNRIECMTITSSWRIICVCVFIVVSLAGEMVIWFST